MMLSNNWLTIMRFNVLFQAQAGINANNLSNPNFNNRPDNTPLSNNNEIEYFLPGPSKESDKNASTALTKQLQKKLKMCLQGVLMGHFHCS